MPVTDQALRHRENGSALINRGLLVAARDEFIRWLSLVERTENASLIIPALNGLTKVACLRGQLDEAWGYLQRALGLTDRPEVGHMDRLRVYLNLMMLCTDTGRLDEALDAARSAAELGVDDEPTHSLIYWLNLSVIHWRRQEWEAMKEATALAYDRTLTVGDVIARAKVLTNRGIAHRELGEYDLAQADFEAALRLSDDLRPADVAYTYAEWGWLCYLRGDYQAAIERGREALAAMLTDVALLDKEEVARVSYLFGVVFSTLGQRNLALKYLNRAAAYYSQLGLHAEWQRSTETIGRALSEPVQRPKAHLLGGLQQLDFLTAVLDLTDDLESVDPYLRGHSERVASLAAILGESVGLSDEEQRTLSLAARLHDVGMVAVDAELIQRAGPLTEAEKRRVAMHTTIGEEMLRPYGLSAAGLQAIRHHHERYDGQGYPDGLQGEQIPLLARILSVVDVYDSLTSDRFYRNAMTHDEAVSLLQSMAGHQLDPVLVERFLELHQVPHTNAEKEGGDR